MTSIKSLGIACFTVLVACGSPSKQEGSNSSNGSSSESTQEVTDSGSNSDMKLKQYVVQGKKLYQTYCLSCHQADGKGLAQLYPPLSEADYLLENLPRAACIIKNGKADGVTVNGTLYSQMMPGYPSLSPLEVGEILTYITNSWGNDKGISSAKDVAKWLNECEEN